tara:strand:- start:439 stop:1059 length:621 start_codon:yes stop_codon:yes gene_type:complete
MTKNKSNRQWLYSQNKDFYVKKAREFNFRSRAVYKLMEINQKDDLIKSNYCVVDLGSSPGSWSQYLSSIIKSKGKIIAIDLLPMESIKHVTHITGDFTDKSVQKKCLRHTGNNGADLVISDMAPNLTGIKTTDQSRNLAQAELVLVFCTQILKADGNLLIKLFEGEGIKAFRELLKQKFDKVLVRKPSASRDKSREFYILARSFRL